jgi:DNA-binding response OmpR family regulator
MALAMGKKILIADDEPDVVRVLATRLRAHDYQVIGALDGMQAVSQAHHESPDLILLDIMMPASDGYAVLESLRMSSHTDTIPVMLLSGLPEEELQERVAELGVQGFIPKPFDTEKVLGQISALLSTGEAVPGGLAGQDNQHGVAG